MSALDLVSSGLLIGSTDTWGLQHLQCLVWLWQGCSQPPERQVTSVRLASISLREVMVHEWHCQLEPLVHACWPEQRWWLFGIIPLPTWGWMGISSLTIMLA